jgi:hypothetical protein
MKSRALFTRISEAVRIAGSFVAILFFFVFTAILVKVDMGMDRFFSVTMATIWFINCKREPIIALVAQCFEDRS